MIPANRAVAPSQLQAAGTFRPDRHADRAEIENIGGIQVVAPPTKPKWLSATAREVWDECIDDVMLARLANYKDRNTLALYCTAMAKVIDVVRGGDNPTAADIDCARKLAELFGIAGGKSRVVNKNAVEPEQPKNVFARNGRAAKAA